MIPDLPLPAWARRIQQNPWWQFIGLPIVVGFGWALLPCIAQGVQNIEVVCMWGAVNSTLTSLITQILSGHSAGSTAFKTDGTPNQTVKNVVVAQKAIEAGVLPPAAADQVGKIQLNAAIVAGQAKEHADALGVKLP